MRGKTRVLSNLSADTSVDLAITSHLDTFILCNHSAAEQLVTVEIQADGVSGYIFKDYPMPEHSVLDVLDSNHLNLKDAKLSLKVNTGGDGFTAIYTSI